MSGNFVSIKDQPIDPKNAGKERWDIERDRVIQKIGLKTSNEPFQNIKSDNNAKLLSNEIHYGITNGGTNSHIGGVPGSEIIGDLLLNSDSRFDSLMFQGTITIKTPSTIIFQNCRFQKEIVLENGAKAHFIGCLFLGVSRVNNAGAVGNAFVIGCSRKSGIVHLFTTIISETT